MFFITEKPAVLYLQTLPGFLQINKVRYTLKAEPAVFSTVPAVLKIFLTQFKPSYNSFFIAQDIAKATNGYRIV